MKGTLISVKPKFCEKIANGECTILVRKTKPKLETPFKCYIYCCMNSKNGFPLLVDKNSKVFFGDYRNACTCDVNGNADCYIGEGKVIGEFICDRTYEFTYNHNVGEYNIAGDSLKRTCLTYCKLENYGKGQTLYGWRISDLKIYGKPKELSDFGKKCIYAQYQDDEYYGGWFCNNEENGEDCQCFDCPSCGGESCGYEDFAYCNGKGIKPITRPPQSWQYVEVDE